MKLSACLLLAVVAAVSADQGFYQPQAAAVQSAPSSYTNYAPGNYYDQRPPARQGWFDRIFGGSNRRQGIAGLLAGIGPIGAVVGVVVAVVVVVAVAAAATQLSQSGRGLDNDEWEVDHSVWMSQLQRDFEDSWSN
ncbi:hypothetical protein FJT64_010618 [Amphibalanus amphitrite]|uniref:Uncharacterized protein n=1 Tax=Amphibalanus amphitrite TaxID=1232801 RepID=A0A6A4VDL7_AMPAM|nr:uncharacterized protein LOC122375940 [Amphibalanus amphitrite]KAF0291239.1 hypothetical protein FJT64_010618 [Amphibalanus amphitrite]